MSKIGNILDTVDPMEQGRESALGAFPKKAFGTANAKTSKGELFKSAKYPNGVKTFIIYLAPHKQNSQGKNLCSSATSGCVASCLYSAGRGKFTNVQMARMNKTDYFLTQREQFMTHLYREIADAERNVQGKKNIPVAVRLNGTSDIPWENIPVTSPSGKRYDNLMAAFPNVQFYDYTKHYNRLGKTPKNYYLVFSRAETSENQKQALDALKRGYSVAAVFDTKKGQKFPSTWQGYKVYDGDEHDLIFVRPKGVILGLRAKGDAKHDHTGFVIQTNNDDMKLKKGSKEAKAYMAKIRSMKKVSGWRKGTTKFVEANEKRTKGSVLVKRRKRVDPKGSFKDFVSGLDHVTKRGKKTSVHYTRMSGIGSSIAKMSKKYIAIYETAKEVVSNAVFEATSLAEAKKIAQFHKKSVNWLKAKKGLRTKVKLYNQ